MATGQQILCWYSFLTCQIWQHFNSSTVLTFQNLIMVSISLPPKPPKPAVPILFETIFPWIGQGRGFVCYLEPTHVPSLAYVAPFLTGHQPIPVCGPGVRDRCYKLTSFLNVFILYLLPISQPTLQA